MRIPYTTQTDSTVVDRVAYLFTGPVILTIPTLADRFQYKKKSGSSDTAHTKDVIIT